MKTIREIVEENKNQENKKPFSELFKGMKFYTWSHGVAEYEAIGKAPNVKTTQVILVSNLKTGFVSNISWKSIVFADSPECFFISKLDLFECCKKYHMGKVEKFNKLFEEECRKCKTCKLFHPDTDRICLSDNIKSCGKKNNYKYWEA